ncbi:hypothetical protein KK141_19805 [Dyella sp. LX-66]|uniref:hypothetical protein n=1 Tax=unclassified Dyella TaxID=2634549 RepID=UPI001BE0DCE1|nr:MULTISPECIES: hypothetical protein [unclassified Dyella]MBT2119482.1 hypothetical protein [Dyella sp. LX-1]MBT2141802.1 hypothetical protein [Dyella sp. LX-66]
MTRFLMFSCVAMLSLATTPAAYAKTTTEIKTSELSGDQLPGGFNDIVLIPDHDQRFSRWITLPQDPQDNDQVVVSRTSSRAIMNAADKDLKNSRLNIGAFVYSDRCGSCIFRYSEAKGKWIVTGTKIKYVSSSERNDIPAGTWNIAVYEVDGVASHPIKLPVGTGSQEIKIVSHTHDAQIDTALLLNSAYVAPSPHEATVPKGKIAALRHDDSNDKWILAGFE